MSQHQNRNNSRRQALVGVAGAPLVISTAAVAKQTDPHPAWLSRYWQVLGEIDGALEGSEEEERLFAEVEYLKINLCNKPAQTPEGLLAQFDWFVSDLGYYVTESIGSDHSRVFDIMRESILRATT